MWEKKLARLAVSHSCASVGIFKWSTWSMLLAAVKVSKIWT